MKKDNMTLKTHINYHHLGDNFDWTGKTLKYVNGEAVESAHSTIRIEEESHGFKVKRNLGSPIHLEKDLKSHIWHNSKRVGFHKAASFRLRRESTSSPPSVSMKRGYNHSKRILSELVN